MNRRGRAVRCLAAAAALGVVFACWSPTEVSLALSTDVPCDSAVDAGGNGRLRTVIFTGESVDGEGDESETETTACAPRATGDYRIGELTVVPRGDRNGSATVLVVMRTDGSTEPNAIKDCRARTTTLPKACIVARRTFKYIAHTSRTINIRLDGSCRGIGCLETETCIQGKCSPSNVDGPGFVDPCAATGCPDAGPRDAAGPDDGAIDAPPVFEAGPCHGPRGDGVLLSDVGAVGPSSKMIAYAGRVFWITPPSGPTTQQNSVVGTRTDVPALETFAPSHLGSTYTAIASDGLTLWSGVDSGPLYHTTIADNVTTANSKSGNRSVSSIAGRPDDAFVSATVGAGPLAVFLSHTATDFAQRTLAVGGTSSALGSQSLWTATSTTAYRHDLAAAGLGGPGSRSYFEVAGITACEPKSPAVPCVFDDEAFANVATGISSQRQIMHLYGVAPSIEQKVVVTVPAASELVVAGDAVYFAANIPGRGAIRYVKPPSSSSPVSGAPPVPADLDDIGDLLEVKGLAVSDCVYFWGLGKSTKTGAWDLRVAPRVK